MAFISQCLSLSVFPLNPPSPIFAIPKLAHGKNQVLRTQFNLAFPGQENIATVHHTMRYSELRVHINNGA
jgi:hypothetical protein